MTRKLNHKSTKEEKAINLKFKTFYSSYMNRVIKKDTAKHYKDHKTDYKNAFYKIEENKEEYFLFNYLISAIDHLNKYLSSDIALPFEESMKKTSEKWQNALNEISERLVFNNELNEIMGLLIKQYNRKVFQAPDIEFPETQYSAENKLKLNSTKSFEKVSISKVKRSKNKTLKLVLQNYTLNDESIYLYYPQMEYDFINRMKFLVAHINVYIREIEDSVIKNSLENLALEAQSIIDQLFYEELIGTKITKSEAEELVEEYCPLTSANAS